VTCNNPFIQTIDLASLRPWLVSPASCSRGIPHHITQRGNRRESVFFEDGDYELYLDLLADAAAHAQVTTWSYCLMPSHVHIVAVPGDEDGLRRTFRYVHRHYTGFINARMRVTGHLWQGRFSSVAMDEAHIWSRRCAMSRSIQSGPGWSIAPRTGVGPVRGRILPGRATSMSTSRRHWSGSATSPPSWDSLLTKR